VVVHGDREDLLGGLLADHVLVEERLDLAGLRDGGAAALAVPAGLFRDDVVAELDALVARCRRRAAMSFFTSFCDFPQKEQARFVPSSFFFMPL